MLSKAMETEARQSAARVRKRRTLVMETLGEEALFADYGAAVDPDDSSRRSGARSVSACVVWRPYLSGLMTRAGDRVPTGSLLARLR